MIRRAAVLAALLVAGCQEPASGPTGDLPLELVVTDAQLVEVAVPGTTPVVLIAAEIRNPTGEAIVVRPDCGGLFALERWSGSEWVRYRNGLIDCIPDPSDTIDPGVTRTVVRTFTIEVGLFRLVVEEHPTVGHRVRRSATFEVKS
jgi:hypothetical protein